MTQRHLLCETRKPRPNSPITGFRGKYAFLSNFSRLENALTIEGKEYKTVEHAFQAKKTTDKAMAERIKHCNSATMARFLGRRVALRSDWEEIKDEVQIRKKK